MRNIHELAIGTIYSEEVPRFGDKNHFSYITSACLRSGGPENLTLIAKNVGTAELDPEQIDRLGWFAFRNRVDGSLCLNMTNSGESISFPTYTVLLTFLAKGGIVLASRGFHAPYSTVQMVDSSESVSTLMDSRDITSRAPFVQAFTLPAGDGYIDMIKVLYAESLPEDVRYITAALWGANITSTDDMGRVEPQYILDKMREKTLQRGWGGGTLAVMSKAN